MVLEARGTRHRLIASAAALVSVAVSADAGSTTQAQGDMLLQAVIGSTEIRLSERQGKCVVSGASDMQEQILDVPAPCGFVRAQPGRPAQTYSYDDVGAVVFVAGPPAQDSEYGADSGVRPESRCSNHGQALFVRDGRIKLGPAQTRPLGYCHLLGFDEKDFYAAAHP